MQNIPAFKNLKHSKRGLRLTLFAGVYIFLILFLFSLTHSAEAKGRVIYDISFPNAAHHEAHVSVTLVDAPARVIEFQMSRTSPGRYALHEFAKNVYAVSAVGNHGHALAITRPNPYAWDVRSQGDTVRVTYTLYANHPNGTYSGIDRTEAHLNMPATFMWAEGMESWPITIHFHIPQGSGWKIETQLEPTSDSTTYKAPDLQYFMDSPAELSNFTLRTWKLSSNGHTYTFRLALNQDGTDSEATKFAHKAKRICQEEEAVFGSYPHFDYGTYTFLADYLPYVYPDGMEHRNSCVLTSKKPLVTGWLNNLGTLAHEFFHSWNMERIRPKSLEPFNLTKANMSGELWFGEGFTNYYEELTLVRAGFINDDQFAHNMSKPVNYTINASGRKFFNPVQMSEHAPLMDGAASIAGQNNVNTYISSYTWGSVIAMGLDLMLRTQYPHLSLDSYMKAMWLRFGKTGIPYTLSDMQSTLADITNDPDFAESFFKKYIYGRNVMDLKDLLAKAGFDLKKANSSQPIIKFSRAPYKFQQGTAVLTGNTIIGSPLYKAGLDRGDIMLKLNNKSPNSNDDIQAILDSHSVGDTLSIQYVARERVYNSQVVLASNPTLEIIPYESEGIPLTPAMKQFRKRWLGNKIEATGTSK